MKIGIISDIHSNVTALRACTDYLENERCDEYLFLGDYVSDTPYTREIMDFLYEFISSHRCQMLRGNREDYMIAQRKTIEAGDTDKMWLSGSASGNLLFTYEKLTDEDIDFFESLPITFRYEKEGLPAITCCHGSPESTRELLELEDDKVGRWLERIDTDYMICAHTHFPGEVTYKNKHYYNAGCVGISINDAGYAQCMIIEDFTDNGNTSWRPQFLRIPYDNRKVVRDILSSGLSDMGAWFVNADIQTLLTGIDNASKLVKLAYGLQRADGNMVEWPHIEERYFAAVAGTLGIIDYRKQ